MVTEHEHGNCGVVNRPRSLDGILPPRADRPSYRYRARGPYSDRRLASLRATESLHHHDHLPLHVVLDRALEIGREMEEWLDNAGLAHDPGPHRKVAYKEHNPTQ
jgi:hypothetical protein